MSPLQRLRRHGAPNHGVVTRYELHAMGFSDSAIRHLLRKGEICRLLPRVYAITSFPRTWRQTQLAACRWAGLGSASSGRAAGKLHELEGIDTKRNEVTIPGHPRKPTGTIIVHRTTKPIEPIRTVQGIPVTDLDRTLFDLASCLDPVSLEIALDDSLFRGRTTAARLDDKLRRFGGNGHKGIGELRALLDERLSGNPPSQRGFNVRLRRLFRNCPYLPMPLAEYRVVVEGVFVARVDFAYPHAQLAIEGQSRKHHTGAGWARHNARLNALAAAGWEVVHATWADAKNGGADLLPHVALVLARRQEMFTRL